MGFLNSIMGAASKIGKFASKYTNVGGKIGNFFSGVNKAANLVNTVANTATKFMPVVGKIVEGIKLGGNILNRTGIGDKITGGKFSRIYKGFGHLFNPSMRRGITQDSSAGTRAILTGGDCSG